MFEERIRRLIGSKEYIGRSIKWHAIASQEDPMFSLLLQLRENIDNRVYGFFLGDHLSGHIPAITFALTVNKLYHGRGWQAVPLICIEGSNDPRDASRIQTSFNRNFLRLKHVDKTKRALIITDVVDTGRTIKNFQNALQSKGIGFDVATLHSEQPLFSPDQSPAPFYQELAAVTGAEFFLASDKSSYTEQIFRQYWLSGLEHNATRSRRGGKFKRDEKSRETTREVLHDVRILSDRLVENYNDVALLPR